MDPYAALDAIMRADSLAIEEAGALNGWIKRGGYSPRIEIHPACDAWMMGDRFGSIVSVGRKYLTVRMERSGRLLKFAPSRIYCARPVHLGGI